MKLASGLFNVLSFKPPTISLELACNQCRQRPLLSVIYLLLLILLAGLAAFAQLLSDDLIQQAVNVACWVVVCAVAALALMAMIKVLEGLLDS